MNYRWANQSANFSLQGNQFSYTKNRNDSLNAKAYLNPQIVNCELIKKTLSSNRLQGVNKIHVNPNFRGNRLSNLSSENHPHLINSWIINSQDMALPKVGALSTSSANEGSHNINSLSNENKVNLNCFTAVPHKSRFKKVNTVSPKNNQELHFFSKRVNNLNSFDSFPHKKTLVSLNNTKSVSEKSKSFSFHNIGYKDESPIKGTCQSEGNCLIYKSKTKIIKNSKIRGSSSASLKTKSIVNFKNLAVKRQLNLSKFNYNKNRKAAVSVAAKAVRNKYMYLNNLEQYKKSKFKIDKRTKSPETAKKSNPNKIKDIRKLFPKYFYNKIKLCSYYTYNVESCTSKSRCINMWRKNQPFDKVSQKVINNKFPNKQVVTIGGILYKSTANKLTLARKKVESCSKKSISNSSKAKNYIVYVRGEKFILEKNGKALRRQSDNVSDEKTLLTPKRIDIGGVTYLQKSKNVLIRTNIHQARNFVNKAKNKSIALLANLHKRSSMPCMIYHRFGRCFRHIKGLCMYKHDPKNIAVCKKFLKGDCDSTNCLLSHEVVQEKMATCHFFLNGFCVRENCPFLHVKLSKNAAICESFLQGFCNLGKECPKRHLHQCPKFDKNGVCSLGSKCPYPHKNLNKTESICENSDHLKNDPEAVQYYVCSDIQRQRKIKKSVAKVKESASGKVQKKAVKKKGLSKADTEQSSNTIKCFPKRIKLDKLPCFIPLNSDS